MTKTTRKNRTAASIIHDIRQRLAAELTVLVDAEDVVSLSKTRVAVLQGILDAADTTVADEGVGEAVVDE